MARLEELEAKSRWLHKMYLGERLNTEIVQEALHKSGKAVTLPEDSATDHRVKGSV